jgi:hypothetical protein
MGNGSLVQQTTPSVVDNRRDEGSKLPVKVLFVLKFAFFSFLLRDEFGLRAHY